MSNVEENLDCKDVCYICLKPENLNKIKCCNANFHEKCLDSWYDKIIWCCPNCRSKDDEVAKKVNAKFSRYLSIDMYFEHNLFLKDLTPLNRYKVETEYKKYIDVHPEEVNCSLPPYINQMIEDFKIEELKNM